MLIADLFLGMVMLPMKLKQKKNKNYLRQKINYNIYNVPIRSNAA